MQQIATSPDRAICFGGPMLPGVTAAVPFFVDCLSSYEQQQTKLTFFIYAMYCEEITCRILFVLHQSCRSHLPVVLGVQKVLQYYLG